MAPRFLEVNHGIPGIGGPGLAWRTPWRAAGRPPAGRREPGVRGTGRELKAAVQQLSPLIELARGEELVARDRLSIIGSN